MDTTSREDGSESGHCVLEEPATYGRRDRYAICRRVSAGTAGGFFPKARRDPSNGLGLRSEAVEGPSKSFGRYVAPKASNSSCTGRRRLRAGDCIPTLAGAFKSAYDEDVVGSQPTLLARL